MTLLILMLLAALMAGFFAAVNSDMRSNSLDKDQTRAYAAAHAGLEKLTSDLADLFNRDPSPSVAQINAFLLYPPVIPGYQYIAPGGTVGSGYNVSWKADASGNPAPDDPTGSNITAGPYKGLKGIITKYPITITARSTSGGSEVRLRRELQTVAVPVFQFGVFSQTDLSFFAGPNFNFGGRVHTNGTMFLAQGDSATLQVTDRMTAAAEIIRWQLSNGFLTGAGSNYTGNVSVVVAKGGGACCTGWTLRNLARTEGSLVNGPGTAANEPTWTPLSIGTYKSYIRSRTTGATVLNLPIVSQGATPIDLIRRPVVATEDTTNAAVYVQRMYAQASLRILLSDRVADLTTASLPTVTATAPVAIDSLVAGTPAGYLPVTPIARSIGPIAAANISSSPTGSAPNMVLPVAAVPLMFLIPTLNINTTIPQTGVVCTGVTSNTFKGCTTTQSVAAGKTISATVTVGTYTTNVSATTTGATVPPGGTLTVGASQVLPFWRNFFWANGTAVAPAPAPTALVSCTGYTTTSFTGCSWSGATAPANNWTISTNAIANQDTGLNGGYIKIEKQNSAGVWSDVTTEILNLGFADSNSEGTICADPTPNAVIRIQRLRDNGGVCDSNSQNPYDYWPNALYDTREGDYRDGVATSGSGSAMNAGGLMNFVELDVANLKRWLAGTIPAAGATGGLAWNNNGYIVYFSDRRGNHRLATDVPANGETGEYGSEDVVNRTIATGLPDAALETAEDVNGNGIFDTYGATASVCCTGASATLVVPPSGVTLPLGTATVPTTQFAGTNANPGMARVNKQVLFRRALKLVNAGLNLPTAGLTVAAENPVYVEGNYNATASLAGVTANPDVPAAILADAVTLLSNQWTDSESFLAPNDPSGRQATAGAAYRMAVAAGKGLSFVKPTVGTVPNDFGTDGGVHNFLRYLENWNGNSLWYNGSLVSLWINRQAIGTYKCCTNVYSPPVRVYSFDTNFLLPTLLPPGTPMFRDINTLTFRQILRPTQ